MKIDTKGVGLMSIYEHDCDNCTFLGTDKRKTDWYVCGPPDMRSLIRRHSSEGCEYTSGPIAGCVTMTELEKLAARMGFKFNNFELVRFGKLYVDKKVSYSSAKDVGENGPHMADQYLLSQENGEG